MGVVLLMTGLNVALWLAIFNLRDELAIARITGGKAGRPLTLLAVSLNLASLAVVLRYLI